MSRTILLDPVTRIEGHLKIEIDVDNGAVAEAKSSGTLFRGIETILTGRDPQDAIVITQRICGVCPVMHGIASARVLENAAGDEPPANARLLRHIMGGANLIQSHILHFYLLTLFDFVHAPNLPPFTMNDAFPNRFTAEETAAFIKNYKRALLLRQQTHELIAIFAGRMPMPSSTVFGGVTGKISEEKIAAALSILEQIRQFAGDAYYPDMIRLVKAFPEYASIGRSGAQYFSFGGYHAASGEESLFPSGVVADGTAEALDENGIAEDVSHSFYESGDGGEHTVSALKTGGYSWIKAPRYKGRSIETGPLARVVVGMALGKGKLRETAEEFLAASGLDSQGMHSVSGRHLARAAEVKIMLPALAGWLAALAPGETGFKAMTVPADGGGRALAEAPRGALGHWIRIADGKIANYRVISPTTWNASPRDENGIAGPMEQALAGAPVADENHPVEALRVVRSFDPCLACSIHALRTRHDKKK